MSWPKARLGDLCEINIGRTPARAQAAFWSDGVYPWVSIADMSRSEYISDTKERISEQAVKQSGIRQVSKGTVLLSFKLSLGKVGIATVPLFTNEAIAALPIKDGHLLDARYLFRSLQQINFDSVGNRAVMGRTLNKKTLAEIEIPLPPPLEQRRIAAILDKADALRRKRKCAIELSDSLLRSVFFAMFGDLTTSPEFTRGTVADWVKDFDSGKNLAPDSDSLLSGYHVLKVSAVTSGRFISTESKPLPAGYIPPEMHLVRKGDLLFSRANTTELIGATAFVDRDYDRLVLPDKIWRFVWNDNNIPNPLFMRELFGSPSFRYEISKRATGTSGSMKNISKAKVLQIPISMPPRELQDQFVTASEGIIQSMSVSNAQLELLNTLFSSLQHRAFSGQL